MIKWFKALSVTKKSLLALGVIIVGSMAAGSPPQSDQTNLQTAAASSGQSQQTITLEETPSKVSPADSSSSASSSDSTTNTSTPTTHNSSSSTSPSSTPPSEPTCDPNYSGACVPNVYPSDVDCAGGRGNGPYYTSGPVHVIGTDHYHLDGDGDNVACE